MKISAFTAEFNPFHAGHKLLVDNIRKENDAVVVIMSGNFVQRGECALFDKTSRAAAAIANGVDLVIELPCVYALSSAEGFARGAIETLDKCGVIDSVWFGSECGDIDALCSLADILNEEDYRFSVFLNEKLSEGASFPAARQYALGALTPQAALLDMPNNILAVEYIRALKTLRSDMKPVTIERSGAGYNDTTVQGELPSASAIRALLEKGETADMYMLYNYEGAPVFMKDFDAMIAARLKTISQEELCLLPDCNEELASRLTAASAYNSFDEILAKASCKRYAQSRIRRILCNMLINNKFKALPSPAYIRPLAFNKVGSEILHKMKSTASLSIAARGAVLKGNEIFNLECRSTDVYNLARGIGGGKEFDTSPIISC